MKYVGQDTMKKPRRLLVPDDVWRPFVEAIWKVICMCKGVDRLDTFLERGNFLFKSMSPNDRPRLNRDRLQAFEDAIWEAMEHKVSGDDDDYVWRQVVKRFGFRVV